MERRIRRFHVVIDSVAVALFGTWFCIPGDDRIDGLFLAGWCLSLGYSIARLGAAKS